MRDFYYALDSTRSGKAVSIDVKLVVKNEQTILQAFPFAPSVTTGAQTQCCIGNDVTMPRLSWDFRRDSGIFYVEFVCLCLCETCKLRCVKNV